MSRAEKLTRLVANLTDEQVDDLCFVIREAEIEKDWYFNGEDSFCENEDPENTLQRLAEEFEHARDERDKTSST
jgi:hypothetical protein